MHLASFMSLKKDKSKYSIITAPRIIAPITAPFISLKIPQKATLLIITAPPILLPFIAPCNFLISIIWQEAILLIITAPPIFLPIITPYIFLSLKIWQEAILLIITAPSIFLPIITPYIFLISENMAGSTFINYNSATYISTNYYTLHLSYL